MRNNTCQLCRQRHQKSFFTLIKTTALSLLHHQYTQQTPLVNDGHAQKCVKVLLPNTGKELKVGMILGFFKVDRLSSLCDQTDQALALRKAGHTHQLLVESLGRLKHLAPARQISHVHTAHLSIHSFTNTAHSNLKSLIQPTGCIDLLNNVAQSFEHSGLRPLTFVSVASQRQGQFFHCPAVNLALE